MKLGEIYFWDTDKASGHDQRWKYHVYLCEAGWRADGHAFLFINKANYGGDYTIHQADYPFFPLPVSYVSCSNVVTYTDAELATARPEFKGCLSKDHMIALRNTVLASEVMEQWQIDLAATALAAAYA